MVYRLKMIERKTQLEMSVQEPPNQNTHTKTHRWGGRPAPAPSEKPSPKPAPQEQGEGETPLLVVAAGDLRACTGAAPPNGARGPRLEKLRGGPSPMSFGQKGAN